MGMRPALSARQQTGRAAAPFSYAGFSDAGCLRTGNTGQNVYSWRILCAAELKWKALFIIHGIWEDIQ